MCCWQLYSCSWQPKVEVWSTGISSAETSSFQSFMFSDIFLIVYVKWCILKHTGLDSVWARSSPSARNSKAWFPKRLCFMAAWALLRAFLLAQARVVPSHLGNSEWTAFVITQELALQPFPWMRQEKRTLKWSSTCPQYSIFTENW